MYGDRRKKKQRGYEEVKLQSECIYIEIVFLQLPLKLFEHSFTRAEKIV